MKYNSRQLSSLKIVARQMEVGQIFFRVLRFSPASIIPPMLNIHSSSTCCLGQTDEAWEPAKK
jgi:hypothetical protein